MSQHCYHCHSAIAQGTAVSATINGQTQQFCCHACLGVASLIDQHNLNQYYQVRQQASPRPNQNHDQSHWQAYDIDAIAQQYLHSDNDSHELHLYLDNIHCAACAWLIRSALQDIHNLQHIHINTTTARAQIRWHKDHPLKLSQLLQTLDQLGYPPHLHTPEQSERHYHQQRNQQLLRLIIAGLGSMQVMMLSTGLYTGAFHGIDRNYSELLRWVSLAISIPVLFYSGHPILKSAWQGLRQRHINMDLPIALATVGAFIASAYHTLLGQGEVYFDSVTMFIFFISISRFIEFLTRRRAQHNEHRFARLLPDAVYKLINNTPQLVPLNTIQTNDHLHIPPTHTIPVDGIIQTGTTRIDQSMLTGESDALYKQTGDTVLAGTTNLESPITLKATQTGQQTTLAGIRRLIARAEQHRSPKLKRSETIAQNAILLVLILAIAGYLIWQTIDPSRAFEIALAILVATCPCALSLATPSTLTAALNNAHRHGILIKDSQTLDKLTQIKHIIFDKTGTLTQGTPQLIAEQYQSPHSAHTLWRIAKTLESHSTHPLAWYFIQQPHPTYPTTNIHHQNSAGIKATINQENWLIGSKAWLIQNHPHLQIPQPTQNGTHVYLATADQLHATYIFDDPLRPDLPTLLQSLSPYILHIASGDRQQTVKHIATQLNIPNHRAQLSPEDKLHYLESLKSPTLMIGDGINDAPVLAAAHVSIAVGKANPLSQTHADIVLLNQSLHALPYLLRLSEKSQRLIKQNLIWASAYNLTILPLALSGHLTPWLAALGMSLSSLLVVGNAMRIHHTQPPTQPTAQP